MKRNGEDPYRNRTATWPDGAVGEANADEDGGEDMRGLRALSVLEQLTDTTQPLTLAQLAKQMRVPKTTLMRLLKSMESRGYILRAPAQHGFVVGPRATALALRALRGPAIRRDCRAILKGLVQKLGETCNLTVPDSGRVLYVERVETSEPLRMHLAPGTWVPMHCTASGKLFLASMSVLDRQRTLSNLPLTRHSPHTILDPKALENELIALARRGLGIDREEFIRGMIAVAVPVVGNDGQVAAAVACHAPTARQCLDDLLAAVPHLRAAAEAMRPVLFPPPA